MVLPEHSRGHIVGDQDVDQVVAPGNDHADYAGTRQAEHEEVAELQVERSQSIWQQILPDHQIAER